MFKNPNISLDYFELRVELELNFHVWNQKKTTQNNNAIYCTRKCVRGLDFPNLGNNRNKPKIIESF